MTGNHLYIQDESGDKKYFTLVPNYILNHSSAIDQSLYLQMKRFAGENGKCTASKNTLIKKMGIGEKAFNKSLKYLIDHKWIEFAGNSPVITPGGVQNIKTYKINDIWRQNLDFYEGGAESNHPAKVVPEVTKGGVKSSPKVVSKVALIENKDNIEQYNRESDKLPFSLENIKESDFEEIAGKYQVPVAFVRSKYDDMVLWAGERPKNPKLKDRDWKLTLMRWVKSDSIKIKSQPRKGGMIHVES
jgi:hypothetical protein